MFNKPTKEASLSNKSSCLAQTLGVTKFIFVTDMIWVTLFVLLNMYLDIQQTHLRGQFVEQKLMLSSNFRCDQIHNCH
jgi:hypothetical protein